MIANAYYGQYGSSQAMCAWRHVLNLYTGYTTQVQINTINANNGKHIESASTHTFCPEFDGSQCQSEVLFVRHQVQNFISYSTTCKKKKKGSVTVVEITIRKTLEMCQF